jgi:hypothetical protein
MAALSFGETKDSAGNYKQWQERPLLIVISGQGVHAWKNLSAKRPRTCLQTDPSRYAARLTVWQYCLVLSPEKGLM